MGARWADNSGSMRTDFVPAGIGDNRQTFIAGWWNYDAAMTAGTDVFWIVGNGQRACFLAATAGELEIITDRATTDWRGETTDMAWSSDTWRFVAWLFTGGASTNRTRVWSSPDLTTAPVEHTLTETVAGSGSANSDNEFYIGINGVAASTTFRGVVEGVVYLVASEDGVSGTTSFFPFPDPSGATISADDVQAAYDHLVLPAWRGDYERLLRRRYANGALSAGMLFPLHDNGTVGVRLGRNGTVGQGAYTTSGGVTTQAPGERGLLNVCRNNPLLPRPRR
jgi:hypothetical protein